MSDRCPPHNFKAAWASEDVGVLYCSMCGDIRQLSAQTVEAPAEEIFTVGTTTYNVITPDHE